MNNTYSQLINEAINASKNSYSPYSKYKVGASLMTKKGKIYTGTNIENSSYSATVCAERVAIFKAVSDGEQEFVAMCIVNEKSMPYPCGICRQVLSEFAKDIDIIVAKNEKEFEVYHSGELLPHAFDFKSTK